jgi:putative effector of murein hydrolase
MAALAMQLAGWSRLDKVSVALGAALLLAYRGRGLHDALKLPVPRKGEASLSKTVAGAAVCWAADRLVAATLRKIGGQLGRFPSSVATIILGLAGLSGYQMFAGEKAADALLKWMEPGRDFLGKWMLVSIAVPLTSVPMAIEGGSQWLRLGLVTVAGWLFTVSSTALTVKALQPPPKPPPKSADALAEEAFTAAVAAAEVAVQAATLGSYGPYDSAQKALGAHQRRAAAAAAAAVEAAWEQKMVAVGRQWQNINAWGILSGATLLAMPWVGPAPAQCATTIFALLQAQRLPANLVRVGLHPLLICATSSALLCWAVGATRGIGFAASFGQFRTLRGTFAGPGDLLFELMNASLVALGLRVFALRGVLLANLRGVMLGSVVATAGSLFGTVAVGRLLRLTATNSLMLSQRCTSGGFALVVCDILEVPSPMMFLWNIISGLLGGCIGGVLLDQLRCRNRAKRGEYIPRGVAIGASSHATGTASLLQDGEMDTAALASVSLVVCGILHAVAVSVPPVHRALYRLAGR